MVPLQSRPRFSGAARGSYDDANVPRIHPRLRYAVAKCLRRRRRWRCLCGTDPTHGAPAASLATLSGVAASGQALANTRRSAQRAELTRATSAASGAFSLRIPRDAQAPLELQAEASGLRASLPEIPSPGGGATAHLNPVTEAVRASLDAPPATFAALGAAGADLLNAAFGPATYARFASDPAFRAATDAQSGSSADVLLDALTVIAGAAPPSRPPYCWAKRNRTAKGRPCPFFCPTAFSRAARPRMRF